MSSSIRELYTNRVDEYVRLASIFLYPQGLRAFFESYDLPGNHLCVLDAGCGTGLATFALLHALKQRGRTVYSVQAFDLTPTMLARFQQHLDRGGITQVELRQANVLDLQALPPGWSTYDLIVSAAMLEHLSQPDFVTALSRLRERLASGGRLLLFITRANWLMNWMFAQSWLAHGYSQPELREAFAAAGFGGIVFKKFTGRYFWLNLWGHVAEGYTP